MLFVVFQLGADRYALAARTVLEVLPLVAWKEIPAAPGGIAGVLDYRGEVVPLVDLSALALGRAAERRASTRILVTRYTPAGEVPRLLALLAEQATGVAQLDESAFQPSPVDTPARFLGPVARDARGLLQRIEPDALLDEATRAALYPVTAGGGHAR